MQNRACIQVRPPINSRVKGREKKNSTRWTQWTKEQLSLNQWVKGSPVPAQEHRDWSGVIWDQIFFIEII